MKPEDIYFLCMAAFVLSCAPFSVAARIVLFSWAPGQIVYWLGGDPTPMDMACDILAIGASFALSRSCPDMAVAAFFVPMAVLNMSWALGAILPWYAWWMLWGLAVAQTLVVPFTVDWSYLNRIFGQGGCDGQARL